ncbi:hypothetical protein, partial [Novosphingobium arvoryzae]|uniref:hypothetical protein n=1 Tax=Novosphingobium arvoryzae TaxID=1256514 RepID=UPI001E40FED7
TRLPCHHRLRRLVGEVNQIRPSNARVFRGVQLVHLLAQGIVVHGVPDGAKANKVAEMFQKALESDHGLMVYGAWFNISPIADANNPLISSIDILEKKDPRSAFIVARSLVGSYFWLENYISTNKFSVSPGLSRGGAIISLYKLSKYYRFGLGTEKKYLSSMGIPGDEQQSCGKAWQEK